jgi:large subunit ribosomal protein L25
MAETASLAAEVRERTGKGVARALRRHGRIPAVIYGDRNDPVPISLDRRELAHEIARPGFFRQLYDIVVEGSTHRVLPREVQRHPVTDAPLHVDFLRVGAGAKIAVNVAVVFANEEASPGLKRGGVLNIVRREVELNCPANAIPEALHIDLTGLEIGDSIHISDIALPPDCSPTIADRDFTIATIAAPTVVREEAAAEAEAEEVEAEVPAEVEAEAPAPAEEPAEPEKEEA